MDNIKLVNLALLAVGAEKITSLTDASKAARLANTILDACRDEMIEYPVRGGWKFLRSRTELAQLATAPAFGYDYQYVIPSHVRRILAMVDEDGDDIEYKTRREVVFITENGTTNEYDVLLSDEDECRIRYIARRTDPAKWPAWFCQIVYLNIALKLVEPLKADKNKLTQLFQLFDIAMNAAKAANAAEDNDVDANGVNTDMGNNDVINAASEVDVEQDYVIED